MDDLKTFSVLIAWNDHQRDEGNFGEIVRARDCDHAERIVRARMMRSMWSEWSRTDETMSKSDVADMYATEGYFQGEYGVRYFGSLQECTEGALWKAADLETALRGMLTAYGRLHDFLSDAIEGGRLKKSDLPDDYKAIVEQLVTCNVADHNAKAVIAEIEGL